jgi:hypothetical protein
VFTRCWVAKRIFGSVAVPGQYLTSYSPPAPANFDFCPRSSRCPPSHPFPPYALPFAPNLHTANFHAQFCNNIMLPKRFTQTGVSEQHYTDLESRYPKNMPCKKCVHVYGNPSPSITIDIPGKYALWTSAAPCVRRTLQVSLCAPREPYLRLPYCAYFTGLCDLPTELWTGRCAGPVTCDLLTSLGETQSSIIRR